MQQRIALAVLSPTLFSAVIVAQASKVNERLKPFALDYIHSHKH